MRTETLESRPSYIARLAFYVVCLGVGVAPWVALGLVLR